MISRIHNKLGTAGFIVSIVALVAALGGGAYAAQQGLNGKQKNEVRNISKSEAKKLVGTGPQGPAGPAGPAGPGGAKGDTGNNGTNGTNGKNIVTGVATVAECPNGGMTAEVEGTPASKKKVCNGAPGAPGEDGSPWTLGGVIPPGETVVGAWDAASALNDLSAQNRVQASLSYTLPYPGSTPPELVIIAEAGEEATKCPGDSEEPEAAPGFLCVYEGVSETLKNEIAFFVPLGTENTETTSGLTLVFEPLEAEPGKWIPIQMNGTFAVTAPEAP